ncbi:uncharacterized protein LOC100845625 [Brachypodium distachyon]|uniref:uncharacterized protein LOC100845625 n=1 Tax=Brachypodium distachyon TaxID=15368 RepID=UPI000D0DB0AD|nr:uncharacterized protein LOC100845625 [Brachypodium distachyon]|eukprot:XP_024314741.1 uncharacterized protein LOC100845625 [Brachypodium distachyon]
MAHIIWYISALDFLLELCWTGVTAQVAPGLLLLAPPSSCSSSSARSAVLHRAGRSGCLWRSSAQRCSREGLWRLSQFEPRRPSSPSTPRTPARRPLPNLRCSLSLCLSNIRVHCRSEHFKRSVAKRTKDAIPLHCKVISSVKSCDHSRLNFCGLRTETYDLYVEYHRPSFFLMCGMICEDTKIIGWIAVALGVLHYFRIASTAYYDSFNVILFSSSVLGCCNGFLWLYHPRLCISFEYKIGSYIIGCLRGLEAFLWLSRLIAPMLSKMERTTIAPPQPDKPKYKVHVW